MTKRTESKQSASNTPEKKAKVDENEWKNEPPHVIYKVASGGLSPGAKVACFALEGTLVVYRKNTEYPIDEHDWKWSGPGVPNKLKELHKQGFQLVVFTNQGSIKGALQGKGAAKITDRIDEIIGDLALPVTVYIATDKSDHNVYKPATGMWDFMVAHHMGGQGPDTEASCYVGDAAGLEGDSGDSDKQFAAAVGVAFHAAAIFFGEGVRNNQELADCFHRLAVLHQGEIWKRRAMRHVAHQLEASPKEIKSAEEAGEMDGVGASSVKYIEEWLETGKIAELEAAAEDGADVGQAEEADTKDEKEEKED